ncbi:hypothetical protein Hanom_Chr14g01257531 [Helianthus anomalus]
MGQIISPALLMISNYNHAILKIIDWTSNYYGYYKWQTKPGELVGSARPSKKVRCGGLNRSF